MPSGTVKAIRNFDTAKSKPKKPCKSLLKFVKGLTPGDVALVAVAETACPNIPGGMAHASMAQCAKALHKLGSRRSLEIGFRKAWALAAIVGDPPTNLAEGVGGSPDEVVQINAEAFLDADRDGVTDNLDPDNDNDGVPDEAERSQGTDILDPASH